MEKENTFNKTGTPWTFPFLISSPPISTFTQLLSPGAEWLCARTNIGPRLCAGEEAVRGGDDPHPAGSRLQQHGSQTPRAADGRAGAQNCCRESTHCSPCVSLSLSVCLLAGLSVGLPFRLIVCLSVCLAVCSPVSQSLCLFARLFVCLFVWSASLVWRSVCLSACFSACLIAGLSVSLSFCFFVCLSVWSASLVWRSNCVSFRLFFCLSLCLSDRRSVSLSCLFVCLFCLYVCRPDITEPVDWA